MKNSYFLKIKPTHSSIHLTWFVSLLVSLFLNLFLLPFWMVFFIDILDYRFSNLAYWIYPILTLFSTYLLGAYTEKQSRMDARIGYYIISPDHVEIVKAKSQSTTHFEKVNQITFKLDAVRGKQGIGHITLNLARTGSNTPQTQVNQANLVRLINIPDVQSIYNKLLIMFDPD